ncbi:MAG: hypothetical protein ACE5JN_08605 [Candidatus Methylomirabilia bacterium]
MVLVFVAGALTGCPKRPVLVDREARLEAAPAQQLSRAITPTDGERIHAVPGRFPLSAGLSTR